jgi:hypothetical protein
MAIISKPQIVYKGVPVSFTLFKTNLISHHVVSSDSRFSDSSNWAKVNINYRSSQGNQTIIVEFDNKDNFQVGKFFASEKARTFFIVDSIVIIDLDGEILKISRADLNTATFDLTLTGNSESEEFVLLMEDGASFLLESGDFLVLE